MIKKCLFFIVFISINPIYSQVTEWAYQIGGIQTDKSRAIATDIHGNIYVTGQFQNTVDFDPGPGVSNLTAGIYGDAFICKLNSFGNIIWAGKLGSGSSSASIGLSIIVDDLGNVYSTGQFEGTVDFDPGPSIFNMTATSSDIYVSKLDASGNFIWAKKMVGDSYGQSSSIDMDDMGNIYVSGTFEGTIDFDPGVSVTSLSAQGSDIFICKLNESGSLHWAKKIGGNGYDYGLAMAVNAPTGDVYTTGSFWSTADFDPGPLLFEQVAADSNDAFFCKINTNGDFEWANSLGGIGNDEGTCITVTNEGKVYASGTFENVATTFMIVNLYSAGGKDIFVFAMDSAGYYSSTMRIGNSTNDYAKGISLDGQNHLYLTGLFSGTLDFDETSSMGEITAEGPQDIFIHKMDLSVPYLIDSYLWSGRIGSTGSGEIAQCIATDTSGNVYVSGDFVNITDFDPGSELLTLNSYGGLDGFVAKLSLQCIEPLDISIIQTGNQLDASPPVPVISYQWIDCTTQGLIAGATNQSYIPITNGDYAVIISTPYGCADTSNCLSITNLSIESEYILNQIYPNPSSGGFNLQLYAQSKIVITNTIGEIVFQQEMNTGVNYINLQDHPSGIYYISILENERRNTVKVVKI